MDDHDFDPQWAPLLPTPILSKWMLLNVMNRLSLITFGKYVGSKIKLVAEKIETISDLLRRVIGKGLQIFPNSCRLT